MKYLSNSIPKITALTESFKKYANILTETCKQINPELKFYLSRSLKSYTESLKKYFWIQNAYLSRSIKNSIIFWNEKYYLSRYVLRDR